MFRGLVPGRVLISSALLFTCVSASQAVAQTSSRLTEPQIVAAFQHAGLPVGNLHQEPVHGTPSGPPMTEESAWRFSIPEVAPSGGKIMIFASSARQAKKQGWFQSVSPRNLVVHKNVILWLDPRLKAARVAAYRKALVNLEIRWPLRLRDSAGCGMPCSDE